MTWLTWRQFRASALVGFGALVALTVLLGFTGPHLVHLYDATVRPCRGIGDCNTAMSTFGNTDAILQHTLTIVMQAVPALLGMFWGAPLIARELDTGAYQLAWTQSVTRTRWFVIKLAWVGLAAMMLSGLLSLAVTWWSSPLDRVGTNRFDVSVFGERGIAPIGYAAFAFAVGALVGLVTRRTLPSIAITLAVYIAARVAFTEWIRPRLLSPLRAAFSLGSTVDGFVSTSGGPSTLVASASNLPGAWIYSARIVDRSGHAPTYHTIATACPALTHPGPMAGGPPPGSGLVGPRPAAGAANALRDCVTKLSASYHTVVTYQPADRYWTFQALETASYLAAGLALAGLGFWWLRHRPR
jgi:hypothetical protein